jgi:hypothetical protein
MATVIKLVTRKRVIRTGRQGISGPPGSGSGDLLTLGDVPALPDTVNQWVLVALNGALQWLQLVEVGEEAPGASAAATGLELALEVGAATASGSGTVTAAGLELLIELGAAVAVVLQPGEAVASGIELLLETGAAVAVGTATVVATGTELSIELGAAVAQVVGDAVAAASGLELSIETGAATASGGGAPPDHTTTWEAGLDGWTIEDGPDPPYVPWGRVSTGSPYAGSYHFALTGSDDGAEGYTAGYIQRTFANISTGNLTYYGRGMANGVNIFVYRNGVLIDTWSTTTTYAQRTVAITGGANVTIKIMSDFGVLDGAYIDNIVVPGGG